MKFYVTFQYDFFFNCEKWQLFFYPVLNEPNRGGCYTRRPPEVPSQNHLTMSSNKIEIVFEQASGLFYPRGRGRKYRYCCTPTCSTLVLGVLHCLNTKLSYYKNAAVLSNTIYPTAQNYKYFPFRWRLPSTHKSYLAVPLTIAVHCVG